MRGGAGRLASGTGLVAVNGYSKSVNTMEAAAFELVLFNSLGGPWRDIGARYEWLEATYPDRCDRAGWV